MGRIFQITLNATPDAIAEAAGNLAVWLEAEHVPEPGALLARLALDELGANLVMHGPGSERILRVECQINPGELLVQVDDDGPPFNPLDAAAPDLGAPLEQRVIGGLGIHLLRQLSDCFEYERFCGRNRVTLVKHDDL